MANAVTQKISLRFNRTAVRMNNALTVLCPSRGSRGAPFFVATIPRPFFFFCWQPPGPIIIQQCFSTASSSYFSSFSKKRKKHEANIKFDQSPESNPFQILSVQRTDTYQTVKRSFLKLAMAHHPDRNNNNINNNNINNNNSSNSNSADSSSTEQLRHKEIFIAARKAFEQMMEGPDGLVILKSECPDYQKGDSANAPDMDMAWFKQETGYDMPYMDHATMKEVAKMTEEVGGGLDRDGGMWTLAKMITNAVNSGGDANAMLRLEAGEVRDGEIDGILRRKRKR